MIIGFVGTPGSGKSYEAVKKILDNIRLGRKIFTNIDGLDRPECREAIKAYCNLTDFQLETCLNHLSKAQAVEFWLHCEPGSMVVIDEVHKLFSNREWQSKTNKDFTEWASTHRHEGYDLVLVTQDIEKVDKHARSLIEWTYFFRKVNFFGSLVQQKYICYAYAGDDHNGQALSKNVRRYDPAIFPCYKSYSASDVKELGFMQHVNVLKHPVFYAIPVLLLVLGFFYSRSSFATGDMLGAKAAAATPTQATKIERPALAQPPPALLPPPPMQAQPAAVEPSPVPLPETTIAAPAPVVRYLLPDGRYFYSNTTDMLPAGAVVVPPGPMPPVAEPVSLPAADPDPSPFGRDFYSGSIY